MKKIITLLALVLAVCVVSVFAFTACKIDLENADYVENFETTDKEGSMTFIAAFFEETIKDPDMVITCKNKDGEVQYTETVKGTSSYTLAKDDSKIYAYKVGEFYYVAEINYEQNEGKTVETHSYYCSDNTKPGYYVADQNGTMEDLYKSRFCQFMNKYNGIDLVAQLNDAAATFTCKSHGEKTDGKTSGTLTFKYTSTNCTINISAFSEENKVRTVTMVKNDTTDNGQSSEFTWTFVYGGASVTLPDTDAWDREDAEKVAQSIAPYVSSCDPNTISIYCATDADQEYVIVKKGETPDWTAAQELDEDGNCDFVDLDPATIYTIYVRIKATNNKEASAPITLDYLTPIEAADYPEAATIGEEITYVIEEPAGLNGVTYQWYLSENGGNDYTQATLIKDATSANYTPTEADAGKYLLLVVCKDGLNLDLAIVGPVYPVIYAPQTSSRGSADISITCLNDNWAPVQGQEYVIAVYGEEPDWSNAQELDENGGCIFENLEPATVYTVYARIKATGSIPASSPVTLDVITLLETVSYPEEAVVGEIIFYTVEDPANVTGLTYQWYLSETDGNDYSEATPIAGATYSFYRPTEEDVDKYLLLVVCKDELELDVAIIGPVVKPDPRSLIFEDLQPLYDSLIADGDKSIKLTVTGSLCADGNSEAKSYTLNAILNMLEQGGNQFVAYGKDISDPKDVYVVYDNDKFVFGNDTVDVTRLVRMTESFLGVDKLIHQALVDEEDGRIDEEDVDTLTLSFIRISSYLDVLDSMIPILAMYDVSAVKLGSSYVLTLDAKDLVPVIQGWIDVPEDVADTFDLSKLVTLLDEKTDGAFSDGSVKVNVMLTLSDDGVEIVFNIENEKNGGYCRLSAKLTVDDEVVALPNVENAESKDLYISVPVTITQKEVNATVDVVVHISDMFKEAGRDYITASVTVDEETVVRFNLNDYYVYLDVTGLLNLYGEEEAPYTAYYYALTDENENPVSFLDSVIDILTLISAEENDLDDAEGKVDDGNDGNAEDDDAFDYKSLLSYLRFINRNGTKKAAFMRTVANLKAIIENDANKKLFANVIRYEENEDGFVLRVDVNESEKVDLLTIINLFVGIPAENDGFVDFSESMLIARINSLDSSDKIYSAFEKLVGVELEEVISDLYVEVRGSIKDGLTLSIALSDCSAEKTYFNFEFDLGASVKTVSPVEQFELTEKEIEDAQTMSDLRDFVKTILEEYTNTAEEE